jgi:hypothetical protein
MYRQLLVVSTFAVLLVVADAQETKTGIEADVNFMNGSNIRLRLQSDTLEISTAFGKLTVPVKEIRSIDFGAHLPAGYAEKIDAAVKQLASSEYREREKGVAALVDLGPYSYAAAVEASRSKDSETATRGKAVMQKLQAKYPKADLKTDAEDKIVTSKFTIVGRIVTSTLKAKTDYFGEADLSLANMRTMRLIGAPGPEVDLAIDSSKYAAQGAWMPTNYQSDGRSSIVITAKGLIDIAPDQGGILAGPSGYRTNPAGAFPAKKAKSYGGQLQGKFGEQGDIFVIGDRFEGTPSGAGKLYLHITPSVYGSQCSGSYDVKVVTK